MTFRFDYYAPGKSFTLAIKDGGLRYIFLEYMGTRGYILSDAKGFEKAVGGNNAGETLDNADYYLRNAGYKAFGSY